MGGEIVSVVLIVFLFVTLWKGVRIVPQGEEWVVERLGKYLKTLMPGLHVLIPYIDNLAYKVTTKDLILDIPQQEVITRDNAVLVTNAIAFVKVTDTQSAVYGVTNFQLAVMNLIQTTLRAIIGAMDLDEALSSRDQIKAKLKESISDDVSDWGLTLKSVEIQDISPSPTMQKSMEMQAAAERERKATVTKAEGDKQAAILEAEARLESAKRDAEAQVRMAEASAESIRRISAAIPEQELPAMFILGEKYIGSLKEIASANGSKTVLLPGDLMKSLEGLLGRKA
ncbi:SPFH/Band 7/PHB domain protein [Parasulfuritortus cantonensis]|uniref:SPFH/Band 7/PHB domain protein n=1 Tax=Parasulfuritortus cantonensis TaxID=2528202 RepID=A0A4R1BIN9_9PROT|nr:SPFH domain-containing protein [Parasulfuritortus cantonensis]TCJ17131.1 SPFH/Band 7/PHB domain protein [Parasulfuritortus cantonensis]